MAGASRSFDKPTAARALAKFDQLLPRLVATVTEETGFTTRDSSDLCEAARAVLEGAAEPGFSEGVRFQPRSDIAGRTIVVEPRPVGGVAVVLPQNAFPYMALLAGASAWSAGNKVWLKAPSRCQGSRALVQEVVDEAFREEVSFSDLSGREFAEWAIADSRVKMLHFIGGSATGSEYLRPAFESGTTLLVDGDGNCQVFVGESFDPDMAADLIAVAATRFNGQTCTSAVGVVASPGLFEKVRDGLSDRLSALVVGDPLDPSTDVGPLFSPKGVESTARTVESSGGRQLCGGPQGNAYRPALVESPRAGSDLVRSGVFAPVVWIAPGGLDAFQSVWASNRYPLCAGVLSHDPSEVSAMGSLPGLGRLTVNGDPSVEDPLEPWGATPSSGNGKVEPWVSRYQRTVQFDVPDTG